MAKILRNLERRLWRYERIRAYEKNDEFRQIEDELKTDDGYYRFDAGKTFRQFDIMDEIQPWWLRIVDNTLRALEDLTDIPRKKYRAVKRFYQRGKRGWADEDLWNFDAYLASVISGGLHGLADIAHGFPSDLREFEDKQEVEELFQAWVDSLHRNADCIALYNAGNMRPDNPETLDEVHESLIWVVENFGDLWD